MITHTPDQFAQIADSHHVFRQVFSKFGRSVIEMSSISGPRCPDCSGGMVLRLASKGHNKGKHFYGCSRYPRCKGTRPYTDNPPDAEAPISSKANNPAASAGAPSEGGKGPVPPPPPKEKRPLTEQQRKELTKLRDRLLNLSSRNRSIRLNRLDAKWTFDLSLLNPFGIEAANELLQHSLKSNTPKVILPKPHDDATAELHLKLSTRLTHLNRSVSELQREKGLHDLYIGFPFLVGVPIGSETVIQAPIFLLPVTLEKTAPKKGASNWVLTSSKETPAVFNKTLFLALSKLCNLTINPSLFEEEVPNELYGAVSFIQKTHEILNEYGIRCEIATNALDREINRVPEFTVKDLPSTFLMGRVDICQYAVLGHFPQSNSSIQRDYDRFLESDQDELDSITCFLSAETPLGEESHTDGMSSVAISNVDLRPEEFPDESGFNKSIDDRKEAENFLLLPSDSSQDRILLELADTKTTGLVVWGPPGTGKSQTIVNVIGDCLARGNAIMVASELSEGDEIKAADLRPHLQTQMNPASGVSVTAPSDAPKLPFTLSEDGVRGKFNSLTQDFEQALVRYALEKTGSNVEAARFLGMSRGSLNNRRKNWGWSQLD